MSLQQDLSSKILKLDLRNVEKVRFLIYLYLIIKSLTQFMQKNLKKSKS